MHFLNDSEVGVIMESQCDDTKATLWNTKNHNQIDIEIQENECGDYCIIQTHTIWFKIN